LDKNFPTAQDLGGGAGELTPAVLARSQCHWFSLPLLHHATDWRVVVSGGDALW